MKKEVNELLQRTARIEEHTSFTKDKIEDQERRLRSLEKKWWSSLGAIGIATMAFIKSFIFQN